MTSNNDELYHYGVLGMRWGVRRGNSDKVYSKANKKLNKFDSKSQKYAQKKYKHANPVIRTSISDGLYESAARKEHKYRSKAIKWTNKMVKVLGEDTVSTMTNSNGYEVGKEYVDLINTSNSRKSR